MIKRDQQLTYHERFELLTLHKLVYVSNWEKIIEINKFFNTLAYGQDIFVWGKSDYWATRKEFLSKGAGDCEDYSMAKVETLKDYGFDAWLAIVQRIDMRAESHAVCFVRHEGIIYVLDNFNPFVVRLDQLDLTILKEFKTKTAIGWLSDKWASYQSRLNGKNDKKLRG